MWYNILQKADMLNFDEPKAEDGEKLAAPDENNAPKPQHLHQKQAAPKRPGEEPKV